MTDWSFFGDSSRLFLNISKGCLSSCKYCYLPLCGIETGVTPLLNVSAESLVAKLMSSCHFVKGRFGTIITIGCLSESFHDYNRDETIKLISKITKFENPIQIATKQAIRKKDFWPVNKVAWPGQINLFISCPVVDGWELLEEGTARPSERFNILYEADARLKKFIYIKPFLKEFTLKAADYFIKTASDTNTAIVLGKLYEGAATAYDSPIFGLNLKRTFGEEFELMEKRLQNSTPLFAGSIAATIHWRDNVR